MNDRTVHRAVRAGTKTVPIDNKPRPKQIRCNVPLDADGIATAVEMARADRIKRDIAAYAIRKREL